MRSHEHQGEEREADDDPGQRTRTNARTKKGARKTVGAKKKEA